MDIRGKKVQVGLGLGVEKMGGYRGQEGVGWVGIGG